MNIEKIEIEIKKYFNTKKLTEDKIVDFIEMKQDFNLNAKKYILFYELKFNKKY